MINHVDPAVGMPGLTVVQFGVKIEIQLLFLTASSYVER